VRWITDLNRFFKAGYGFVQTTQAPIGDSSIDVGQCIVGRKIDCNQTISQCSIMLL
jgi:hypothetical protein